LTFSHAKVGGTKALTSRISKLLGDATKLFGGLFGVSSGLGLGQILHSVSAFYDLIFWFDFESFTERAVV